MLYFYLFSNYPQSVPDANCAVDQYLAFWLYRFMLC